MCTVFVHLDTSHIFCVNIACNMISFVNGNACFALFFHFMRKNRTIQSGSYDKVVIMFSHKQHLFSILVKLCIVFHHLKDLFTSLLI